MIIAWGCVACKLDWVYDAGQKGLEYGTYWLIWDGVNHLSFQMLLKFGYSFIYFKACSFLYFLRVQVREKSHLDTWM